MNRTTTVALWGCLLLHQAQAAIAQPSTSPLWTVTKATDKMTDKLVRSTDASTDAAEVSQVAAFVIKSR